ncbi:Auxin response factor 3 [Zea mays]|uniref:Auxin response factor n=3 Tax=Zea mays TaxID=4577 RepID=K7V4X6_MAIZE|nr:Auxin response factor 3 [Zea mays]AQL00426.1 Auxin response factor 3 [Zea mays]AQL00436.1 Auxin response factor 3 [Zea mays]|eukprot:XP_020397877.1 auxin response factor 3 isoform X2 [Zea mays]
MGIDLNMVDGEGHERRPPPVTCRELWHACAGPVVALPRRGSLVVYLPQGHLAAAGGGDVAADLPPHVVCRVADVELCADAATDEVCARLALVAEGEAFGRNLGGGGVEGDDGMEDFDAERKSGMLHMFCKTLTASDTSTHGGFSVPRRAAEDCFPPLDYNQLRPSQELVAKDLHGAKWKFRHIYRGQPRRHLLTTGWSSFVNKKKLVSGDAVLFLRGDDGELRLGVRRAIQLKNEALFEDFNSDSTKRHSLTAVADSLKNRSVFHISYNPRATASEYIIPYAKFLKSLNHPVCIGARINFQCHNEDVSERRSGVVVRISEIDPMKWPGSKWRSLLVRWEDGAECNGQDRVSPWEIEIAGGSVSVSHSLSASSSKRTKLCPQGNLDVPAMWNGCTDSMETGKLPRVLQGQELMSFRTCHVPCAPQTAEAAKLQSSDASRFLSNAHGCALGGPTSRLAVHSSGFTYQCVGFNESIGFSEVLQGQEISRAVPKFQGMMSEACSLKDRYGLHSYMRAPVAVNGLSATTQECSLALSTPPGAQVPSLYPGNVVNRTVVPQLGLARKFGGGGTNGQQSGPFDRPRELWTRPQHETPDQMNLDQFETRRPSVPVDAAKLGSGGGEVRKTSCRLFGFSLTEKILPADDDDVKEVSYETECQNPRMLDLFGYNCSTPSAALPALCAAAPFGM